jgi:hypothetical protein
MKKKLYTLIGVLTLFSTLTIAQVVPDGTIAADFTFTDMNGQTQHLYEYLNQGKYVALDISATWCDPCWEYHSKIKTMEKLYQKHDTPGDGKWKVLFIEGDETTTDDDIKGTGNNTMGNWLDGTPFPICNPPKGKAFTDFRTSYDVQQFPTLYLICPDKKIYSSVLNDWDHLADWQDVPLWEKVALSCGTTTGINKSEANNSFNVYPNPATDKLELLFNINTAGSVKLQVVNTLGQEIESKDLGILNTGNQSISYSTKGFSPGFYYFILSTSKGNSFVKKVMIQ